MPKRRTLRVKKSTYRRRRRTTKRSSKYARKQQKAASTWIRKKYTKTFVMDARTADSFASYTVSIIGGPNVQNPTETITLKSVDQDGQLSADMELYQFFRIRGVSVKMFFPMPTTE